MASMIGSGSWELPGTQASSIYDPASCLSPSLSLKPGPHPPDRHLPLLSCGIARASLVRPFFPYKPPGSDLASSRVGLLRPPREGTGDRQVLPVVTLTHGDLMLYPGKGLEITASPQMAQVCRLEPLWSILQIQMPGPTLSLQ